MRTSNQISTTRTSTTSTSTAPSTKSLYRGLRLFLVAVMLLCGLKSGFAPQTVSAVSREALNRALKATVQVLVPNDSGRLNSTGSGTIMDAENGYILTNFHVMGDNESGRLTNSDGMAVIGVMPPDMKSAPILKYLAKVVKGDPKLDLALLKITALYDNQRAPLPDNLGLTAIPYGDSDKLLIADPVAVYGYPGIGGNTVTFTDGKVAGFLDDDRNGVNEWIKTDAEVNRGNSGGLATDDQGNFIGVPSAGVSDVETAGKISLIRDGNLSLRFMEGALMGTNSGRRGPGALGGPSVPVRGAPKIVEVQFGTAIDRNGAIRRPAVRFPSDITDLYAAFRYEGFSTGATFTYVWYFGGEEISRESIDWADDRSGDNYVYLSNDRGLQDGFYEIEFIFNDQSLFRGSVVVGEQRAAVNPSFGKIIFATSISDNGQPVNAADVFEGVTAVYAVFPVSNMTDGTIWTTKWFYENDEVASEEGVWEFGDKTSHYVWLEHPDGLPDGHYRLELYIEGALQESGEFDISKRATRAPTSVGVQGVVTDADNSRRKIVDALIVFLKSGYSVQDWIDANYDEAMVYAQGVSDRRGEYQLDKGVIPGQQYGVVAYHEAYELVRADNYEVPADSEDPFVLDVEMPGK